jgi:FG-GAP-like repeat
MKIVKFSLALLVTVGLLAATVGLYPLVAPAADEAPNPLAAYYGFGRLELYKLQQRSSNLLAADLNGDGRNDLILVDNSNSRLDLLQQRDKQSAAKAVVDKPAANGAATATGAATAAKGINTIESDKRFEHRKISVDREVAALASGDFNGDGRKDLAYFAVPDQLTLAYQSAGGEFTNRKRIRLPDVQPLQWILAAGDLNHDGKDDLAILGKHDTFIIYQAAAGEMAPPVRLMNTVEKLGLAQIADLDGDGRNDLCYLTGADEDRPLCVRLQGTDAKLGPELRCELPKYRGVTLADIDGKPGHEVLAIEAQTGRVKVHALQRPAVDPSDIAGQLIQYGFGTQGSGKNRDLAVGDINGDGLTEVVVTDPESAQVIVFVQQANAGLDLGTPYPGLVGAEQVRIGDLDGDKTGEVLVLSTREKTIGISRMQNGRLSFPQGVPLDREPAAIDLADLNGDGRPELIIVGKERGASSSGKFTLQALTYADGGFKPHRFGDQETLALSLKNAPERLVALDANRDGKTDFLMFTGSERPPVFLLANAQGVPTEAPAAEAGFGLGNVSPGGLFLGTLEQSVVLVAQNNFARNVAVGEKNQWQVLDQYNAAESDAKIVGAATIDLDGHAGREIVLVDSGVRKLRVLRREGMLFRPWREVDIGQFPYRSTHVADLNGDGREDLLLFGNGKFGVLYAGRTDPRLKTIASYETKLEKVHFSDLVVGDLNADGQADVAVIDTQSQYVEILTCTRGGELKHALHFKVFETKSIVADEHVGQNPRESVIADVTGDGRADLVLLCHDRVLVYPQDAKEE